MSKLIARSTTQCTPFAVSANTELTSPDMVSIV